jgi:hypothetical protein
MRLRLVIALIASVAVAACGSGSSGTHAGTTGAASTPSPAALCARIPTSKVQRLVLRADPRAPHLRRSAGGTPRLLQCHFTAHGVKVVVTLDRAQNNRQRFDNRVVEMTQFSATNPSTRPRPVAGVGDAASGNEGGQWIPAYDQLLAYRPGQYLIVDFSAGAAPDSANRDGAASLGRLAFPLLPRAAQGTNRRVQRPTG